MGPVVAQILAASIASVVMFSGGTMFGWASPSLPKLLEPGVSYDDGKFQITSDEGSWVVSFLSFGAIFGPLLVNFLADRIGRKWCLSVIVIPNIISWIVIGLAMDVKTLYIGRFIGGIGLGACYALLPMYLGEIAEPRIRGAVGTLMSTSMILGMLLSYATGPWISRQMLCGVLAIPPLIFLILFPWLPETPYFWLMKGSREKAEASLVWLRRRTNVKEELAHLENDVLEEQKMRKGSSLLKLFSTRGNRKALLITVGLLTLQQFSGVIVIISYGSSIFESSGLSREWSSNFVIITGIIQLFAGISVTFIIDIAGRRPILLLCSLFISLFLALEAIFFHLQYIGYDTSSYSWIPLIGIIGYYIFFIPGLSNIPYTMTGELFPMNVKAIATTLLSMYGSATGVITTKVSQAAKEVIDLHGIFYAFSGLTFAGIFFIYFCIPETKKVSLEDIQIYLNSSGICDSKTSLRRQQDHNNIEKN